MQEWGKLRGTAAALVLLALVGSQPYSPRADAYQSEEKQESVEPSTSKAQFPAEAVIVICENLQQALSAVPAGSVILSGERYRELLQRLQQLEKQNKAAPRTMILSGCRITGILEPAELQFLNTPRDDAAARPHAILQFELTFRTESPDSFVPIPLQGGRILKVVLHNGEPVWGPDAEQLTLYAKKPGTYLLTLDVAAPISSANGERKITLDRIPMAVVTSLSIQVPEKVRSASIKGAGALGTDALEGNSSRLSSPALGMLTRFELSWYGDTQEKPREPRLSLQGDVQSIVGAEFTQTEATFRASALQGNVSTLRFRLPPGAELQSAERILQDDTKSVQDWRDKVIDKPEEMELALPSPLTASQGEFVFRLKWQQRTGMIDRPVTIGPPEFLAPTAVETSGQLAIAVSPGLKPRVVSQGMVRLESRPGRFPGAMQSFVYRYGSSPAVVTLGVDPAPPLPAVAEIAINHQLRLSELDFSWSAELEILRTLRFTPQEIVLHWPPHWTLSRNVLLSPSVEGFEHLAEEGKVRIRLAGGSSGALKINLMGRLASPSEGALSWRLPFLQSVRGEGEASSTVAQIVTRGSTLLIETEGVDARLEVGTRGLTGKAQSMLELPCLLRGAATFSIANPNREIVETETPSLSIFWQKRRPVMQAHIDAYVHASALTVLQRFRLISRPAGANAVEFLVAKQVLPHLTCLVCGKDPVSDGVRLPVTISSRPHPANDDMVEVAVHVPTTFGNDMTILAEYRLPVTGLRDKLPVRLNQVLPRRSQWNIPDPIEVRCWCGAGIIAQCESDAWLPMPAGKISSGKIAPTWTVMGSQLDLPLEVSLRPRDDDALPDFLADRVLYEVRPQPRHEWSYRVRYCATQVRSPELQFYIPIDASDLILESTLVKDQPIALDLWRLEPAGEGSSRLTLPVPPRWLAQPLLLDLRFRVRIQPQRRQLFCTVLPALTIISARVRLGEVRWRIEPPAGESLMWNAASLSAEQPWRWSGWIATPQPRPLTHALNLWVEHGESDGLSTGEVVSSYSFNQIEAAGSVSLLFANPDYLSGTFSFLTLALAWLLWLYPRTMPWMTSIGVASLFLLLAMQPELLWPVGYALQPGACLLAGVCLHSWLRQQRWRRQLVILPGFARNSSASAAASPPEQAAVRPASALEKTS